MNFIKDIFNKKKHNMFFFVLLWFLPILALNLGYSFISKIHSTWAVQKQKEFAHQEVEALSSGSSFSFQFASHAGDFESLFKGYAESLPDTKLLRPYLETSVNKTFSSLFPEYDIFVFHLPEKGRGDVLYHKSDEPLKRHVSTSAFKYMVDLSLDRPTSPAGKKFLTTMLNSPVNVDAIITSQRAKHTYSFYKLETYNFFWNFFELPSKGTFGYFLFCKNEPNNEEKSRKIALAKLNTSLPGAMGAFFPLFENYGEAIYQHEFMARSKLLQAWAKKALPENDRRLQEWLRKEIPNGVELGNYTLYSSIANGQTHLAVLLFPNVIMESYPDWLFAVTMIYVSILLLILLKGTLLGIWPEISLKYRFTVSYLMASVLPVSLLVITLYGYLIQYKEASYLQALSNLQANMNEFDSRKSQLMDQYLLAFKETLNDEKLKDILRRDGVVSQDALKRVLDFFYDGSQRLPLVSAQIFDEGGLGETVVFDRNGQEVVNPSDKPENLLFPLCENLRNHKLRAGIDESLVKIFKPSLEDELTMVAFQALERQSLSILLDQRRSMVVSTEDGARSSLHVQDHIIVDGKPFCGLSVRWDDQALDSSTYEKTESYLSLKNPEFSYVSYRSEPHGLVLFKEVSRHIAPENLSRYQHQAQMAVFKNSFSRGQEGDMFFYAMPSQKYKDLIFVGSGQLDKILSSTYIRYIILTVILILTILVIVSCSFISSKVILEPISGLKEALDEVAENRLALEISSANKDELGQLCHRFSTMVEGLREREKLATLISDQAVEAISKSGGDFVTEAFDGVALVSDIRGFTTTCEKYDPALVTDLLNEHFAQMSKIISEQGGRIYKYIGDAIEAVFPEDERYSESASMRAFNAASRMVVKLVQINQQRRKSKLFTYRIGIGLKYGQMHSGAVGSLDTRLDYAIIGDALSAAAQLEALSVVNPAFPIVIDSKVNQVLTNTGLGFELIPDAGGVEGYVLNNLGSVDLDMEFSEDGGASLAKPSSSYEGSVDRNQFRYIRAGEGIGFSRRLAFILAMFFVLMTSFIVFLGYDSLTNTKLDAVKQEASHLNMRLMDQLKTEKLITLAFENIFRDYLDRFEVRFNATNDVDELQAFTQEIEAELKEKGYLDRFLVYNFQYNKNILKQSELLRDGLSNRSGKLLAEIFLRLANRNENLDVFRKALSSIFDDSMKRDIAKNYLISSAFTSTIKDFDSKSENLPLAYNYLDYVNNYDGTPFDSLRPKGLLLFSRSTEMSQEVMLKMVVEGYSVGEKQLHLAIMPKKSTANEPDSWVYSPSFPENLKDKITQENFNSINDAYVGLKDVLDIENKKYSIILVREIPEAYRGNYWLFCTSLITFILVLLGFLYAMLRGKTFVTRSVAAKLWLALISVAVIPIITVTFLFELYLNEEENVRLAHKQLELQSFLRRIEMVYNFTNPSAWKQIEKFSYSTDFLDVLRDIEKKEVELKDKHLESDYEELNKRFSSWKRYLGSHPSMAHYDIREMVVASEDWWKTAGANFVPSDFTRLLGEIGFKLTKMAKNKAYGSTDSSIVETKNEMFVDTSLNMLRTSFGDDVYVKMPNAIRTPLTLKVDNSNLGFVIHVLPNLQEAEFTILWMVMFKRNFDALAAGYNNYQDRLASSTNLLSLAGEKDSGFRVFTSQQNQWGQIDMGKFLKERNFFKRIAAYVATSNLPISTSFKSNDVEYLVESNVGVNLTTQVLLGITDKMDIIKALQAARENFYWALALSLFLIVLTANNIAKDILIPVRELTAGMVQTNQENYSYRIGMDRSDELGVLCSSFDRIMKGLEERMLMRKMLSGTAQKETLREEEAESRKADCVLLYIGIPDFKSYMTSMDSDNLFVELKRHVAGVAGIILSEGGEIDKIIGDKQLIAFYVENNDVEGAIEKAIKASLRICKAESSGALPFPVAIGVSSGSVVTGFLGVGEKRDFTLIGDTVNTAARIEALAEKQRVDRCLIAENVYEGIKNKFPGSLLGEIELKGKKLPLKVYSLFESE